MEEVGTSGGFENHLDKNVYLSILCYLKSHLATKILMSGSNKNRQPIDEFRNNRFATAAMKLSKYSKPFVGKGSFRLSAEKHCPINCKLAATVLYQNWLADMRSGRTPSEDNPQQEPPWSDPRLNTQDSQYPLSQLLRDRYTR